VGLKRTLSKTELKCLARLLEIQRRRCFYCKEKISLGKFAESRATVDHFFPLGKGGRNNLSNVVLACRSCNEEKGDRLPTLLEILEWNKLAERWPNITAVTPELHARRSCISCNRLIPHQRLLESIKGNSETRTCSKVCAKAEETRRRNERRRAKNFSPDLSKVEGTEEGEGQLI
jgi:HNH endonuclease